MQLIPSLVLQHLSNPAQIQTLFLDYIKKAGLTITNSKTIAGIAYFHKISVPIGGKAVTFFSGAFDEQLTNVPGNSFVRPDSEHLLIWAVRFETGSGLGSAKGILWTPGAAGNVWVNNLNMTVTTNSEVKIKEFPIAEALGDLTVRTNGLIPFAEPLLWAGQQEMSILCENGEGSADTTGTTAVKLTLIGLGLI